MSLHILSFSIAVPEEGIAHAGGEYYLRHARALVELGHRVTVVAPRTPLNERAARTGSVRADVLLIAPRARALAPLDMIRERFRPALPANGFRRGVRASGRVRSLIEQADVVEFQWTQTAGLQSEVDRVARRPSLLVAHDVMAQSLLRDAQQPGVRWLRRALRRVKYRLTKTDERRVLEGKTAVVAFSEKDRSLVRSSMPHVDVRVLSPALEPAARDWSSHAPPPHGSVLFVGAFDRNENSEAAMWLLAHIWPLVREEIPDARLVLAGGAPTDGMLQAASRDGSVTVTGYIRDLDACYRDAAVAVIPLQNGAGVKFKTIAAMFWGVPVVTTTVGAEGIATDRDGVFVGVEDDAARFASAIVAVLRDPSRWASTTRAARARAVTTFGNDRFAQELQGLVEALSAKAGRGGRPGV